MENIEFLESLTNNKVQDLFWSVASESPLAYNNSFIQLFPLEVQQQIVERHLDWFRDLDDNPIHLLDYLAENENRKLGIHFEQLLYYFFSEAPFVELLLYNQQIIEEGQTLGEVDFIIVFENVCYHLEVSVKYYLQAGDSLGKMIGPNGKDNLSIKLEKVKNHQLKIAHHNFIKELVNRPFISYLFLKGQFYSNRIELSKFFNPNKSVGKYLTISQFKKSFVEGDSDFYQLIKPNWLASTMVSQLGEKIQGIDLLRIEDEIIAQKKAAHIEQLSQYYFIVFDNWPIKLPSPSR